MNPNAPLLVVPEGPNKPVDEVVLDPKREDPVAGLFALLFVTRALVGVLNRPPVVPTAAPLLIVPPDMNEEKLAAGVVAVPAREGEAQRAEGSYAVLAFSRDDAAMLGEAERAPPLCVPKRPPPVVLFIKPLGDDEDPKRLPVPPDG